MTLEFQSLCFACGTVGKGDVVVGNVVEEVKFFLLQHQGGGDGVDGSVTPALVEEATVVVEGFEVGDVCFRAEPVKVSQFSISE